MPKKIILEQSKIDEIISLYKDGKLLKDIASHSLRNGNRRIYAAEEL
jgi:hypothetical protein